MSHVVVPRFASDIGGDDLDLWGDNALPPPPTPALAAPLVVSAAVGPAAGLGAFVWEATAGVFIAATLPEWAAAAAILGIVVVVAGAGAYVMLALDADGNLIGPDHPDWDPFNPAHVWGHVSGPAPRNLGPEGFTLEPETARLEARLDWERDLARRRNLYRPRDYRSLEEIATRQMIEDLMKEFDEINQFQSFVDMFLPSEGSGVFGHNGGGAGGASSGSSGSGTWTLGADGEWVDGRGEGGWSEEDAPVGEVLFLGFGGHTNGPIDPNPSPPPAKVMALVRVITTVNRYLAR